MKTGSCVPKDKWRKVVRQIEVQDEEPPSGKQVVDNGGSRHSHNIGYAAAQFLYRTGLRPGGQRVIPGLNGYHYTGKCNQLLVWLAGIVFYLH